MRLNALLFILSITSLRRSHLEQNESRLGVKVLSIHKTLLTSSASDSKDLCDSGPVVPTDASYGVLGFAIKDPGNQNDDADDDDYDTAVSKKDMANFFSSTQSPADDDSMQDSGSLEDGESKRVIVMKEKKAKTDNKAPFYALIGGVGGFILLILLAVLFLMIIFVVRKRKKAKELAKRRGALVAKPPRKMESEDINRVKFATAGPLKMHRKITGPIRHALEDVPSEPLQHIEFDPQQNEIIDIGSNIDLYDDTDSGQTTVNVPPATVDCTQTETKPLTEGRKAASNKNVGVRRRSTLKEFLRRKRTNKSVQSARRKPSTPRHAKLRTHPSNARATSPHV